MDKLNIRTHHPSEMEAVFDIHKQAFGNIKEPQLVADLFLDPTAQPLISLVAELEEELVGHILLTTVHIEGLSPSPVCSLLAPLAVSPKAQGQGIGKILIKAALQKASETGQQMVFVLGHPTYYPKCDFQPTGRLGLQAPYLIPREHADAWMVTELTEGATQRFSGTVRIAKMLDKPEYWRE